MATPEQASLLMAQDSSDDDDSSSSSSSSSGENVLDDDGVGGNDDDDRIGGHGGHDQQHVASLASIPMHLDTSDKDSVSNALPSASMAASEDDHGASFDGQSPSGPPKKRIKMSLHLKLKGREPSPALQTPAIATTTTTISSSINDGTPTDIVTSSSTPSPPLKVLSSSSPKKSIPQRSDGDQPAVVKKSSALRRKLHLPLSQKRPPNGVQNSDDEEEAEADVIASSMNDQNTAPSKSKGTGVGVGTSGKRKSTTNNLTKSVRLPPISSPGLLIPTPSGMYNGVADADGLSKPSAIFDHVMAASGYTAEARTQDPHRGSSIKREVGDMFDSDVKTTLRFPKLVPDEFLQASRETPSEVNEELSKSHGEGEVNGTESASSKLQQVSLFEDFVQKLESEISDGMKSNSDESLSEAMRFINMIPISLQVEYPEHYARKRLEYIQQVQQREEAIVKYQEEEDQIEMEQAIKELNQTPDSENSQPELPKPKPTTIIPPIPEPPEPPSVEECKGLNVESFEDRKPFYFAKGKGGMVAHLDKSCFHITGGRYFGLRSNAIADPNFVGANAPGIAGLSSGTGLATATTSGSSSAPSIIASIIATKVESGKTSSNNTTKTTSSVPKKAFPAPKAKSELTPEEKKKSKPKGTSSAASSAQLRKIIEEGGTGSATMKKCIVRAAVHASRTGSHGHAFKGPDGKDYPDVAKAFAAHAGIKPCLRCKNNKQGAYHCRLRRKHQELDFDGSNSPAILAPLFLAPLESLLSDD